MIRAGGRKEEGDGMEGGDGMGRKLKVLGWYHVEGVGFCVGGLAGGGTGGME